MTHAITIFDHLHFSTPTQEQRDALQGMADFTKKENGDDFFILCGAAGTGKTSVVSALIGYLNALDIRYEIAAPTGRAARILGRKSKTLSSTIHSMIYNSVVNKRTGAVSWKLKQNLNNKETIYIIDEASMIPSMPDKSEQSLFKGDNSVLHDLVAFVKNGNIRNKVLFLGDRYQLAPISETESQALNAGFLEKTFGWKGHTCLLTEVKRQEDGTNVMKNAVKTRKAMEKGEDKATLDGYRFANVWRAAEDYVKGFTLQGSEHAICIGATHGMNRVFNATVRDKIFGKGAWMLEPGDLMMVTTNWTRNSQRLYNGDHVTIKEVFPEKIEEVAGLHFMPIKVLSKTLEGKEEEIDDYLLVESVMAPNGQLGFEAENRLRAERFSKNRAFSEYGSPEQDRYVGAIRLNYGYAITCHKAQGGEWEKVYFNTFYIPCLRNQYTAVTRAKTNLLLY